MEHKTNPVCDSQGMTSYTREQVLNIINTLSPEDRHKICKHLMKEYAQYDVKLLLCAICGKKLYTHYKEEDQMFDKCNDCGQIVCMDCNFTNDRFSSCEDCAQIYCLICKAKGDVCSTCAHYKHEKSEVVEDEEESDEDVEVDNE